MFRIKPIVTYGILCTYCNLFVYVLGFIKNIKKWTKLFELGFFVDVSQFWNVCNGLYENVKYRLLNVSNCWIILTRIDRIILEFSRNYQQTLVVSINFYIVFILKKIYFIEKYLSINDCLTCAISFEIILLYNC